MGLLSGLFARRGIKFVRKYSETKTVPQTGYSGVLTYEVYRARSATQAREYLNGRTVTERYYYIVVETPDGTWGKDVDGLYKE